LIVPGHQECLTCDETQELLEELASLSDLLQLTTIDVSADPDVATRYNVAAVPTVIIRRRIVAAAGIDGPTSVGGKDSDPESRVTEAIAGAAELGANVRFLGMPGGYEFSTLIADIVDVSKGQTALSDAAREVVRAVEQPVHIKVFVTPT
jgi:alkyl hydroperoxide reductase subunit AhpF